MAKKEYSAPEIQSNAFSQFENVYTACSKNPGNHANCVYTHPGVPSTTESAHGNLSGNGGDDGGLELDS